MESLASGEVVSGAVLLAERLKDRGDRGGARGVGSPRITPPAPPDVVPTCTYRSSNPSSGLRA